MTNRENLRQRLLQLDERGYKAYREIQGRYQFPDFTLIVDRTQGDPFASPSQVRVQLPHSVAGFPPNLYQTISREIALRDYLTRQFERTARELSSRRGTGNSGLIAITAVGQSVLERTSVLITEDFIEVRFVVGLPARGRRIAGHQAAQMLCEDIPQIVDQASTLR